jgi:hypothetical protein
MDWRAAKPVERKQSSVIRSWLRSHDGDHDGMDCDRSAPLWPSGINLRKRFDGPGVGGARPIHASPEAAWSAEENRPAIGGGRDPLHCVDRYGCVTSSPMAAMPDRSWKRRSPTRAAGISRSFSDPTRQRGLSRCRDDGPSSELSPCSAAVAGWQRTSRPP